MAPTSIIGRVCRYEGKFGPHLGRIFHIVGYTPDVGYTMRCLHRYDDNKAALHAVPREHFTILPVYDENNREHDTMFNPDQRGPIK